MPSRPTATWEISVTRPSAPASTTPSGRASMTACALRVGMASACHAVLGSGGLVEAQRGGRREVEALGPAVDRDRDPVVGQGGELVGQPPGLVAEEPGG